MYVCVLVYVCDFLRRLQVLRRRDTVFGTGRYGKGADMWSLGIYCIIRYKCR